NVAATGAGSSTLWSTKNFQEITADLITAFAQLQTQSQDTINPEDVATTLALATADYQYLAVTTDFGLSVRQWLKDTYPKCRVVSAPQLNGANGGANVFYLFADAVQDLSSDDGRTFAQLVPAKFQVLGVQQLTKGYEEDYSNATAGTLCKRPFAVVRYSGI
ncbi:major capsid family protein, partial [Singulisphaera rosea]